MTVRLGPRLENDLLSVATYVAANVLGLSTEQTVATNVGVHADMTQKPLTIDGANLLALRSERAHRLLRLRWCPSWRPLNMPTDSDI